MGGTWVDWLILLVGCVVLLPRLLAFLVNTSLVRFAQRQAANFGLELECQLGSLSFRALGDIQVRLGRWRLPQHPNLYAAVSISIESLCVQLFQKTPIAACLHGASIVVHLTEETAAERVERERLESLSKKSSSAAAEESKPAMPPKLQRAEISTRSLTDAAGRLETTFVHATTAATDSAPTPLKDSIVHWCALKLVHMISVSVQRTSITLRRGDAQLSVCDIGLNLYASPGSTSTHRHLNVELLGLAVRFERVSTHAAFRSAEEYRPDDCKWRLPPLLQILHTDIALEMKIQRCTPVGLDALRVQSGGVEVCVDPAMQMQALQRAAIEFNEQIKEMKCHLPASSTCEDDVPCAPRVSKFDPDRRQFALRFVPKQVKLHLAHIKVEVIHRDETHAETAAAQHWRQTTDDGPTGDNVASRLRKRAIDACSIQTGTDGLAAAIAEDLYTPHAILHCLVLRFNKVSLVGSAKTAFAVYTDELMPTSIPPPPEENHIASIEWAINMTGPSLWMSQNGVVHPRVDVEYCKFTGHSAASFAVASTSPSHQQRGANFPLAAPLHASAAAPFTSPLDTFGGAGGSAPSSAAPARQLVVRPPSDFHPVDSLFHPTSAYRPQTVHTLTFVCVSLRMHLFPSSAEWAQYGIRLFERGHAFFLSLPLPKAPVSPAASSVDSRPSPVASPAATTRRPFANSVTSPESYLRRVSLNAGPTSASSQARFPQFPFSQSTSTSSPQSPTANTKSGSSRPTSPTPGATSPVLMHDAEDDPYAVQTMLTINVKVVDLHVALYPRIDAPLPLCHLSMSEISLRYEARPPSASSSALSHGQDRDAHARLASVLGSRPVLLRASERIEVSVSGFVGSMPTEATNPRALAFHASESLRVPGRFWQLNSAHLLVDKAEKEIVFSAEGLTIRWTVAVLMMGPTIVELIIAHLPKSMVLRQQAGASISVSGPSDPIDPSVASAQSAAAAAEAAEKAAVKFVRGTVTNVTIDFPYVLEFKSDAQSMPMSKDGLAPPPPSHADTILDALSPAMRNDIHTAGTRTTDKTQRGALNVNVDLDDVDEDGLPSVFECPTASSPHPLPATSPSPSPVFGSAQLRPTSLFTYKSPIVNLDVNIVENSWGVLLYQSNCLSEGDSFLTLMHASIAGNERSATAPKSIHVTGDQVIGRWRPALQLGLFKLVKEYVSGAINFKYQLCRVIPAWRHFCDDLTDEEVEAQLRADFEASLSSAIPLAPRLDYDHDSVVAMLGSKLSFLNAFRHWYRHVRERFMPEPFLHVTLCTTNLVFDASLNRQETLGCVIRVQRFQSDMVPHHFNFSGVEIDFMKKPIVFVTEVTLNRVGMPSMRAFNAGEEARNPLMHFTEEHNLLADYLDLALEMREVRVEIAPALDIGSVIDLLMMKVQALLTGIFDLPTLDTISRRLHGPGYVCGPPKPPPSLLLSITQCQFMVVDSPFESWLQQLHLLWLDERIEQERRRALLRVKLESMSRDGHLDDPTTSATATIRPVTSMRQSVEDMMYAQLRAWNSRSYVSRVEALKRGIRNGGTLKKAPLLNFTISSMMMAMGFEGVHGTFYDNDNILRVVRTRKQEEEDGWQEMAKRRQRHEQEESQPNGSPQPNEHSYSTMSHSGSSSSIRDSLFSVSASPVSAAVATDIPDELLLGSSPPSASGPSIGFLTARYFKISLSEIKVFLRNFPLPLFTCIEANLKGHAALVQIKHAPTPLTRTVPIGMAEVTPPTASPPTSSQHARTTSDPLTVGDRASVSIGGVHTVAVEKKYRPFQIFYDIEGHIGQAAVAFSPCFMYTLRDVYDAMDRLVPPLPQLYPIQPIPGMIGLGSLGLATARKTKSQSPHAAATMASDASRPAPPSPSLAPMTTPASTEIEPVNYIHLFRGIAHGRFALSVKDTEIRLIASNDPYESNKYLRMCAGLCALSFEKSIVKLEVHQINAIQVPSMPKQPFLMEMPQMELHATVLWVCRDVPTHPSKMVSPSVTPPRLDGASPVSHSRRHQSISHTPTSSPPSQSPVRPTRPAPSALFARRAPGRDFVCGDDCTTQHVCNMHVSVSLMFSSKPHMGPLSVALHSSTLASLVQFGQVYSQIPPLPFPPRTEITMIDAADRVRIRPIGDSATKSPLPINSPATPRTAARAADTDAHSAPEAAIQSLVQAPTPWRPQSLRVELHGFYLERVMLERLQVTIWEGADLGPARGLRLAMEHVYVALELQEEEPLPGGVDANANLKQSKICFPFRKMKLDDAPTHALLAAPSSFSSASSGGGGGGVSSNSATTPPPTAAAAPSMIYWSLSNAVFGVSRLSGDLVYNERWRELADQESESDDKRDSIFGGSRVVMYTYENQRHAPGLGWSQKNLLPTDRSSWSNAAGTKKVLKEDIKLPSNDWEWENEWHLDFQLRRDGEVDDDGWEYAHDFPRQYSRTKTWTSNVRRRRWIRVRKLRATSASPEMTRSSSGSVRPPDSDADDGGRRNSNETNFVLSLARIIVQQKQQQHSGEIAQLVLDRERALFRLITAPIFSKCTEEQRRPTTSPPADQPTNTMTTATRHSLSRSSSHSDAFTSESLLNFFHIPAPTTATDADSPTDVAASSDAVIGTVHNVHRLNESDFAEAQRAQEALKQLHNLTSSIVTVGGSLGMNPPVRVEEGDELAQATPNQKGVRFNECVLDTTRAARRRKSINLQKDARLLSSSSSTASSDSSSSLASDCASAALRSDLASVHSVRLIDFKILLTIAIRSTLVTLIDQYVVTMTELIQRQERIRHAKYTRGGLVITMEEETERTEKTMEEFLRDGGHAGISSSRGESSSSLPSRSASFSDREDGYSLNPLEDPDSVQADLTPTPGGDTMEEPAQFARGGISRDMNDLLRGDDDGEDVEGGARITGGGGGGGGGDASPPTPNIVSELPTRPRGRAISTASGLGIYRSSESSASGASGAPEPEVCDLFLLEVINPQINVHSEETRGRILFMTQKLSVHGRCNFKNVLAATSPMPSQSRNRSATDATPRSAASVAPRGAVLSSKLDRLIVSVMVDQLQAFVAPTDIDVNAGVVWLNSSTYGILKSIMQPCSFMCTLSLRPDLPAFTSPVEPGENSAQTRPRAATAPGQMSKATKHMSHHHIFSPNGSKSDVSDQLHSIDLNLPELVFAMDSYQFAILLDVMQSVTSPLPIQAVGHALRPSPSHDTGGESADASAVAAADLAAEAAAEEASSSAATDTRDLDELKQEASEMRARITVLEWEMRNVEWVLTGLDVNGPQLNLSDVNLAAQSFVADIDIAKSGKDVPPVPADDSSGPSFTTWLLSTMAKFRRGSAPATPGNLPIVTKFNEIMREHARLRAQYMKAMLTIRLRELNRKPQTQPQNIALNVLLSRVCLHLRKQEKNFLSIWVDGVAASAHLFDDASADASIEVSNLGARNSMTAYTTPGTKESAWSEVVQPLLMDKEVKSRTEATSPTDPTHTENVYNSDMILSVHGVKREEYNPQTDETMIIFQHLEVNLFPLQIRLTYDTIAALVDFFVKDQEKFVNNPSSENSDDSAAAIKNKKQYAKYKNRFLPSGSHILDQDQAMQASAASSNSATPGGKGMIDAIKHSRRVSVAKEFSLYPVQSHPPTVIGAVSKDLYDDDDSSITQPISPLSTTHTPKKKRGNDAPAHSADGPAPTCRNTASAAKQRDAKSKSASRKSSISSDAPARVYQFVYIRVGSAVVNVSYWGNKQNNIEDFEGLVVRLKPILFQKRTWPMSKFIERFKRELIKNMLSQVSATLGSFLGYKLGFRSAHDTTAQTQEAHSVSQLFSIYKEKAQAEPGIKLDGGDESDDDDVASVTRYPFTPTPDSSALLAHFDNELATAPTSHVAEESSAVRSMLFGEKKSKGKKMMEGMLSLLHVGKEDRRGSISGQTSQNFLRPDAAAGSRRRASVSDTPSNLHSRSPSGSANGNGATNGNGAVPPRPPRPAFATPGKGTQS